MVTSSFKDEYKKIENLYNDPIWQKCIDDYISAMTSKPIIIFGASFMGDEFYKKLINITKVYGGIIGFFDNLRTGKTPLGNGPILDIDELKRHLNANIVISVNSKRDKAVNQLINIGFPENQIFSDVDCLWTQGTLKDFELYKDGYEWAYNFFNDDVSKSIIIDRIKRYLFGTSLKTSTDDTMYFCKNLIEFVHNEIFVDGGGFIGDTIENFIKETAGNYIKIYSFEPDNKNYNEAKTKYMNNENINIINKGLWSEQKILDFRTINGTGAGSFVPRVNTNTINSIEVTSIDSFFKGKNEYPTFIKLDVEGSEMEAIRGAKSIIQNYHPKMTICVYHLPEDVYEIPKIIYEYDKTYKMQLVQHGNNVHETVLYAV